MDDQVDSGLKIDPQDLDAPIIAWLSVFCPRLGSRVDAQELMVFQG